jgi:hypothetical protein
MAEATEVLNKQQLVAAITTERAQLDAMLNSIEDSRMLAVVREDGWTAKDLLAHLTAWEQRLLRWIDRWRATGKPERPEPGLTWADGAMDKLNQHDFDAAKELSVADVRGEAADAHAHVIQEVQRLTDEELTVPNAAWDGLALSWIVRSNTDEHYQEHREEIERWLREHPA